MVQPYNEGGHWMKEGAVVIRPHTHTKLMIYNVAYLCLHSTNSSHPVTQHKHTDFNLQHVPPAN